MHIWDDLLTKEERAVIEKGGYGKSRGFGKKPLLLLIDLQKNYMGENLPIEEQLDEWPSGAGEKAWAKLDNILSLRDAARECGIPIIYTRNVQKETLSFDSFATKTNRDQSKYLDGTEGTALLKGVDPMPGELVLDKAYASVFYGTPLQSYLVKLGIDTIIIVGGTTGGCCRATAVDAVTRNYNLGCVEDCMYDRMEISHKVALMDIWMKYGDVVDSDYVKSYFKSVMENREDE